MSDLPSPILIFGDAYVSKNNVISAKKKYANFKWITRSASSDSLDKIRSEAGLTSWDDRDKALVIQDLPNKKQVREFLIDLIKTSPSSTKIIVWDSNGHIKVDPKSKTIGKTWSEFVDSFKSVKGSKIVNNGETLTEKQGDDSISFITGCFEKYKKKIGYKEAKLLTSIVGYDRGMLDSDIKKMCLTCPDVVDSKFILENAFPSTKEAILYKLGNVLDDGSLEDAINMTDRFLASGINANELAVVLARKARWQLVSAYYFSIGLNWESIPNAIMDMGKFPSSIWHNDQMETNRKKHDAESVQSPENMVKYMERKEGLPKRYFRPVEDKESKGKSTMTRKNAEIMPMYFMAEQTVKFVRNRVAKVNSSLSPEDLRRKMLNRAIWTYLFVLDKMCEIRYGENPEQDLQEMIRVLVSTNLEAF